MDQTHIQRYLEPFQKVVEGVNIASPLKECLFYDTDIELKLFDFSNFSAIPIMNVVHAQQILMNVYLNH